MKHFCQNEGSNINVYLSQAIIVSMNHPSEVMSVHGIDSLRLVIDNLGVESCQGVDDLSLSDLCYDLCDNPKGLAKTAPQ